MTATAHGDPRVHLDAAGLGSMPTAARAALIEWTRHEDRYGPHELEEYLDDVVHDELRARLTHLLRAPTDDTVLFTGSADAFATVVSRLPLGPDDRIWTTPYEGVANLTALYAARDRTRCGLDVVPLRPDGDLDTEWMAAHIDDDVAFVSVTQVPAGCGIVNPVEAIGRILAPHRCLYAVDASYAVGQLPVDVTRTGCDLLTGDGWRFLRGPRFIGFAHVSRRLRETLAPPGIVPLVPPHGAAVVALSAALAEHRTDASDEALTAALRAAVEEAPGTELIVPGRLQSGILAFRHERMPAAHIRRRLAARGVDVRKTVAQETPLYRPGPGFTTAVRASVHQDSSPRDIERFGAALHEILAQEVPHPQPHLRPRTRRHVPNRRGTAPVRPALTLVGGA
ncbi:aminotransferase class V-fold PLP-dependent enzyme (plasmid) [Streptomyces sp. cg28]|uniref:aminotransferase class V-fold PLP-dependent enzyme n=1 Tax=Streptomyces sp. cg28 TaxID=3403457 RepID=UPI003B21FFB3